MSQEPSHGALEIADELIEKIENKAASSECYAFRLLDFLDKNRDWVRTMIAHALDKAADGRPLMTGPDGPY